MIGRWRRHPAYPYVVVGLTALVLLVLGVQLARLAGEYEYLSPGTDDFIEYWTAGQLLRQGENPYDQALLRRLQQELGSPYHDPPVIMWNPPWLLIWLYPLLWMPFLVAAAVWLCASAALLLVSATWIWRTIELGMAARPLSIAWVATFLFVPALVMLRMGQTSSVILVGAAGFFYFAARGRSFPAGAFLALTTIKPHVVYLVWLAAAWWVLWQRRWGLVAGVLATLVPTLAVLTLVWPDWITGYRAAMAEPPVYWQTATLGGMLRLLVVDDDWVQFLPPLIGAVCLGVYLVVRRPTLDWRLMLGPLVLLSVPTAAYGWGFDQTVLLIPYLQIVHWLFEENALSVTSKAVITVSLTLIAAGLLTLNLLSVSALYLFWAPWLLGAVYLYAFLQRGRRVPAAEGSLLA